MVLAEEGFGIAMRAGLILIGKVQVDIRGFVPLKAQEGLEGNVVAIPLHFSTAVGAVFIRQVKAGTYAAIGDKLAVFAVGAAVMRRQRVDLGNTGHTSHQGRTNASPAAHLIAVLHRFLHQLLGNHVKHCKAVFNDAVQLGFQPLLHQFRQGVAVQLFGVAPGDFLKLFLTSGDGGGIGAFGDRPHIRRDHIRNLVGVFDHHLPGGLLPQISKLIQHLPSGVEVQGGLIGSVLKALTGHEDFPKNGVGGVQKVDVAGGNHWLVQGFAQVHHRAVVIPDDILIFHPSGAHQIGVVPHRLDFQVIVVGCDFHQLFPGHPADDGLVQFPGFAGAAQQQPFPVLIQHRLGNPRLFIEIVQVREADEPVQVFQPHAVLHQDNLVIGAELFQLFLIGQLLRFPEGRSDFVEFREVVLFHQHFAQLQPNFRQNHGVLTAPVVLEGT